MLQAHRERNRERARATAGAVAFHGLLGWALIVGFDVDLDVPAADRLKLFHVPAPPPPPSEEPAPAARNAQAREGEAAPPNLEARPSPVVAPPPRLPLPSPVPAAPEPTPLPPGSEPTAGLAQVPGGATGTGGEGAGTGSGGQGSGTGGGGGTRAQRIGGRLSGDTDYPPATLRAGIEGSVAVRYVVGTDGRVGGCRVTRSSGNAELDATTCRLIEQRFRYRPARDSRGRPVPEPVARTFDWLLPFRR
ncbi:MAG TPA: energy transducer TonB [Allosphingosinicella sp.]|nr:energy transducer TonB [Allosphingosinicella sp.]